MNILGAFGLPPGTALIILVSVAGILFWGCFCVCCVALLIIYRAVRRRHGRDEVRLWLYTTLTNVPCTTYTSTCVHRGDSAMPAPHVCSLAGATRRVLEHRCAARRVRCSPRRRAAGDHAQAVGAHAEVHKYLRHVCGRSVCYGKVVQLRWSSGDLRARARCEID